MKYIDTQIKKDGFTLIELLVVVAIIGILSTVVLASLGRARTSARHQKLIVDLSQMKTALELYNLDNGSYPAYSSGSGNLLDRSLTANGALNSEGTALDTALDPYNIDLARIVSENTDVFNAMNLQYNLGSYNASAMGSSPQPDGTIVDQCGTTIPFQTAAVTQPQAYSLFLLKTDSNFDFRGKTRESGIYHCF